MLVIALDTSTPSITAGLVECDGGRVHSLAEAGTVNPRAHGELLTPHLMDVLAQAGRGFTEVDAIVVGSGPGPFTGLRVGMSTAAALGHAYATPVYPVCGLDAIAAEVSTDQLGSAALLVATDARRREVYWAAYGPDQTRLRGPHVQRPEDVPTEIGGIPAGFAAGELAERFGIPTLPPRYPTPKGLVMAVRTALRTGAEPSPLVPLYLRRPDAADPRPRKQVTTP